MRGSPLVKVDMEVGKGIFYTMGQIDMEFKLGNLVTLCM